MANRFPIILSSANRFAELAAGDDLDLTSSNIANAAGITADGNITSNATLAGNSLAIEQGGTFGNANVAVGQYVRLDGTLGEVFANVFRGDVIGNIQGNLVVTGASNGVVFKDPIDGNANAVSSFTFNKATNTLAVPVGNIDAVNSTTIAATSITATLLTASNAAINVVTSNTINNSGNVTANNVFANNLLQSNLLYVSNAATFANNVTISGTLATGGNVIFEEGLTLSDTANAFFTIGTTTISNALAAFGANLSVAGNAIIAGNLTVNGTLITASAASLAVANAILIAGSNGNVIPTPDPADRGLILATYGDGTTYNKQAFYGQETSTGNLWIAANIDYTSGVATVDSWGNLETGNIFARGYITATGNIVSAANISAANLSTAGRVTGNAIYSDNYFYANGDPIKTNAAAPNLSIQYNLNNNFAGSANFSFDPTNSNTLTVDNILAVQAITANTLIGNLAAQYVQGIWSPAQGGTGANIPAVEDWQFLVGNAASGVFSNAVIQGANNVTVTRTWVGANANIDVSVELAGANTQVQYNNAGLLGASPAFTFNQASNALTVGGNITASYLFGNIVGNITGNITVGGANTDVLFNRDGNIGASSNFSYDEADGNLAVTSGNVIVTNGGVFATAVTSNANLVLGAADASETWTFDQVGDLYVPGSIADAATGNTYINLTLANPVFGTDDQTANLTLRNAAGSELVLNRDSQVVVPSEIVGSNGDLTLISNLAAADSSITLVDRDPNQDAYIAITSTGNVLIQADTEIWTFGGNGTVTTPIDSAVEASSTLTLQANTDAYLTLARDSVYLTANGSINASFVEIGNNYLDIGANGNLNLVSDSAGAAHVVTLRGDTGVLQAPGNIDISTNYYLGNGRFLSGLPQSYSNADVANYLVVYGGNISSGNIINTGNIVSDTLFTTGDANLNSLFVVDGIFVDSGNLDVAAGNLNVSDRLFVTQGANISGNSTISNLVINGAATLIDTPNTVITGNLQVLGNSTFLNTTFLSVANLQIEVANGAADASQAANAGLYIDGLDDGWLYNFGFNSWNTGIGVRSAGNIVAGNIISNANISAADTIFADTMNAEFGYFSELEVSAGTITLADGDALTYYQTISIAPGGANTDFVLPANGGISRQVAHTTGTGTLYFANIDQSLLNIANTRVLFSNGSAITSDAAFTFAAGNLGVTTISTTGNIGVGVTDGNIANASAYIYGNGRYLTGIVAGGGSANAAGANGDIQFYSSGNLAATSSFNWNNNTSVLTITGTSNTVGNAIAQNFIGNLRVTGTNSAILFNNAGNLETTSAVFDPASGNLTIAGNIISNNFVGNISVDTLTLNGAGPAVSQLTGALRVGAGGAGIQGNLYVGYTPTSSNLVVGVSNASANIGNVTILGDDLSTSVTTGALTVRGGAAVRRNLNVGTYLDVGIDGTQLGAFADGPAFSVNDGGNLYGNTQVKYIAELRRDFAASNIKIGTSNTLTTQNFIGIDLDQRLAFVSVNPLTGALNRALSIEPVSEIAVVDGPANVYIAGNLFQGNANVTNSNYHVFGNITAGTIGNTVQGQILAYGGITSLNTISSTGNIITAGNIVSTAGNTATNYTSATTVYSFATTAARSAKLIISSQTNTQFEVREALVLHNGTTAFINDYGLVSSGGQLINIDATISGGLVTVTATPIGGTSTTTKVTATLIVL